MSKSKLKTVLNACYIFMALAAVVVIAGLTTGTIEVPEDEE